MLRNRLEALFSRELQKVNLGPADYRHIRTIIDRKIPIELVKQVVEDVKRAYQPKYAGDRIRGIGIFMGEIEARYSAQAAPVPTGGDTVVTAPRSQYSPAYEKARQAYYERRVARENPKATAPGMLVQKMLQAGAYDADFHRVIRDAASEFDRELAQSGNPERERRFLVNKYPLAPLAAEFAQAEGVA